ERVGGRQRLLWDQARQCGVARGHVREGPDFRDERKGQDRRDSADQRQDPVDRGAAERTDDQNLAAIEPVDERAKDRPDERGGKDTRCQHDAAQERGVGSVVDESDKSKGGEEFAHPAEYLRDAELAEITLPEKGAESIETANLHVTPWHVNPMQLLRRDSLLG